MSQYPGRGMPQFPGSGMPQYPGQGKPQYPGNGMQQFPRPGMPQHSAQGMSQYASQNMPQGMGKGVPQTNWGRGVPGHSGQGMTQYSGHSMPQYPAQGMQQYQAQGMQYQAQRPQYGLSGQSLSQNQGPSIRYSAQGRPMTNKRIHYYAPQGVRSPTPPQDQPQQMEGDVPLKNPPKEAQQAEVETHALQYHYKQLAMTAAKKREDNLKKQGIVSNELLLYLMYLETK